MVPAAATIYVQLFQSRALWEMHQLSSSIVSRVLTSEWSPFSTNWRGFFFAPKAKDEFHWVVDVVSVCRQPIKLFFFSVRAGKFALWKTGWKPYKTRPRGDFFPAKTTFFSLPASLSFFVINRESSTQYSLPKRYNKIRQQSFVRNYRISVKRCINLFSRQKIATWLGLIYMQARRDGLEKSI